MTLDWFVVLTPLLLALVALPFLFIGCSSFSAAPAKDEPPPPTDPAPQVPEDPNDPIPPKPDPATLFILNLDFSLTQDLRKTKPDPWRPVVKVDVRWVLRDSTNTSLPTLSHNASIVSQKQPPAVPPALDPVADQGANWTVPDSNIGTRDLALCECYVWLDGASTSIKATSFPVPSGEYALKQGATHEFRIGGKEAQKTQEYEVIHVTAGGG